MKTLPSRGWAGHFRAKTLSFHGVAGRFRAKTLSSRGVYGSKSLFSRIKSPYFDESVTIKPTFLLYTFLEGKTSKFGSKRGFGRD